MTGANEIPTVSWIPRLLCLLQTNTLLWVKFGADQKYGLALSPHLLGNSRLLFLLSNPTPVMLLEESCDFVSPFFDREETELGISLEMACVQGRKLKTDVCWLPAHLGSNSLLPSVLLLFFLGAG